MRDLPADVPIELTALLDRMAADFPRLLAGNLVGIYLWGSLTYAAFDPECSDVDCIVVTEKDLSEPEFAALKDWFDRSLSENPWAHKLDLRFIIDGEFLDPDSRCCGFHFGEFIRHGSDANPIIWMNIGVTGITLRGKPAGEIAPVISRQRLDRALLLELEYLKEDLAANAGDPSELAFFHNSYAILTACRIYYTAHHAKLVSKDQASDWALEQIPPEWRPIIEKARQNRRRGKGLKTAELENEALEFVRLIESRVKSLLSEILSGNKQR